MPFYVFNFTEDFTRQVIDDFVRCYEDGLTPNPCIRCNEHLKFSRFLERTLVLGCECMVTGHYAKISQDPATGRYLLWKAADPTKDQSYFLYALTQEQMRHIRFPLGELTKEQARQIAEEQCFLNARKKDSQDICFIPDGDYFAFLKRFTGKDYAAGDFVDMDGKVVGRHSGAVAYTRGQRKGLGLAMGHPVYVLNKDMAKNTVTVGENEELFSTTLLSDDWNFFPFDTLTAPLRCQAKARSRMIEQPATVYPEENGICRVVFDEPQRALTTGQAVVLYDGDTVLGGGTIREVL
jgi:tRNA-specific 2-thiouridylase